MCPEIRTSSFKSLAFAGRWGRQPALPKVAVRRWVLTMPWKRRWDLARHQGWVRGMLRIPFISIQTYYRTRPSLPNGRTGSVTVVQRFGSALNLNVHFHVLMLDGLFLEDKRFRRAPRLSTRQVEHLVVDIPTRAGG